jgi:hypothetical protein
MASQTPPAALQIMDAGASRAARIPIRPLALAATDQWAAGAGTGRRHRVRGVDERERCVRDRLNKTPFRGFGLTRRGRDGASGEWQVEKYSSGRLRNIKVF